ncbi:MAG: phospholipid carrier-dependent glycosyltransferase [Candidatus Omnitrophota bacterium]
MKFLKRFFDRGTVKTFFTVLFLLLVSFFIRLPGFYLPHNHGDQIQYLALAMKLDNSGLGGYNLRGVNLQQDDREIVLGLFPAEEGSRGTLLGQFPLYYDAPLFHKPPLFPYALMLSHKLFASYKPYVAVQRDLGLKVLYIRLKTLPKVKILFNAQFYCTIVPVFFSLLLITATFFMGKLLFSHTSGFYAAMLLSFSPIPLLTSQRIWADDMLAFFILMAFILYYLARERRNTFLSVLAGVCCGLAILTKPNGNVAIFIILIYSLWKDRKFTKILLAFLGPCLIFAFLWYLQLFKTYGSFFYMPMFKQDYYGGNHPWFDFVLNRPWYIYIVNTVAQTPLFFFMYLAVPVVFKRSISEEVRKDKDKKLFLLLWIFLFILVFIISKVGRESRYILPAYPAIAILSAEVIFTIQKKINKVLSRYLGTFIVVIAITASSFWSLSVGWNYVMKNRAIVKVPY